MAFDRTIVGEVIHVLGDIKGRVVDLDITSYTNPGGEAVTANTFGLQRLDMIIATGREILDMDLKHVGAAIRLTVMSTGTELANGLDGGVWRVLAIGK